ncbi:MAG: nitrogen regulation protein NR(II) [Bacteroidota bacterium]
MKTFLEKLFPGLRMKVAGTVALVLLLAAGSFAFFAHRTGYRILQKQAQAKAHGIAEFGQAILEHIMLEGKSDQLQSALESATGSRQAKDVFILKLDGTVALSARAVPHSERIPLDELRELPEWPGHWFRRIEENDSLYEYIVTPIVKKQQCYRCHLEPESGRGYFAVKTSVDDLRSVASEHRAINILMTIVTLFGLGGAIYLAVLFLVIRPLSKAQSQINRVENQIDQVEEGEQMRLAPLEIPQTRDEIADLIADFNKFIQRLNEAHARLHTMHQVQLEQADRLASSGEMAASIAHEIKNPLAGVLGALQVFDADTPQDDPRKGIVREMILQLDRINQAINDLLSYARPTAPMFEEIHVNEIIERTLSLLTPQLNGKQVVVNKSLGNNIPPILADQKLIQQLLWNIFLNALQAMETAGTLTVTTVRQNELVKIQIQDTGKGIPEEHRAKLFKPFFTTKHKGAGLGLAICKRIVEQHLGAISIESHVGRGTTVAITIRVLRGENMTYAS